MIRGKIILIGMILGVAAIIAVINLHPKKLLFDPTQTVTIDIPPGANFVSLVNGYGIPTTTAQAIIESAKGKYDLAKIVSGRELALAYDSLSGVFKKLTYNINSEQRLVVIEEESEVTPEETQWVAEVETIPYEVREKEAGGVIAKSLYETIVSNNMDERLALALAEAFAWQIDFAADIRVDDSFKVVYEERYLDGKYVMPGRILAASFINEGELFRGYWFEGSKTSAGHYDADGAALQKVFLKSPLQYKYISSGFSYARVNPITKKVSPHRGIDYAAPSGTPAVSVGDGTVIQAGWNGYYGISVTIRHSDTYSTVYGHFSSLAKGIKKGAKVKQGQVVGYVGSTGLSTGPHLHYEMHKYKDYVNPFKVEVPPGEPVNEADKATFDAVVGKYATKI